jgi:hypothetical protein
MKSRLTFSRIASAIKARLAGLALYIFAGTWLKRLLLTLTLNLQKKELEK